MRNTDILIALALILLSLVAFVATLFILGSAIQGLIESPHKWRRSLRKLLVFAALAWVVLGWHFLRTGEYAGAVAWTFVLIAMGWVAYGQPGEAEEKKNYAADQRHCGRCEYDLTGNVSGICPECGWVIPKEPVQLERADWTFWWKKWRIDYLESWPRRLAGTVFDVVLLLVATIWMTIQKSTRTIAPVMALTMIHMLITTIRIAAYGKRQRRC